MTSRKVRALVILVSAAGFWACSSESTVDSGPPPAPQATTITLVSGGAQSDTVGHVLPSDVVVRVDDQDGNAMAGQGVSFQIQSGGGTLDPASATTDASGTAATSWTLGTTSGGQQVRAWVTARSSVSVLVDATATADVADSVDIEDGDNQIGIISQPLTDSIVVKVFDQYGNGVPGHDVDFAVGSGGTGSVTPQNTTTDANGEAWTSWTLGPEIAVQTVDVDAGGLKNDPLSFSAQGTNLTITLISPDPLVEGQAAWIAGTGFSTTPANNTVLVDGVSATVTASVADTIYFTAPTFDCKPAREVDVRVEVGGIPSLDTPHDIAPAAFVSLAVGEQLLLRDPTDLCFQFEASGTSEEYLIGVQAVGEQMSRLTPVQVVATKDPAAPAPPALLPPLLSVPSFGGVDRESMSPRARRWAAHREAEAELRAMERRIMPRPRGGAYGAAVARGAPRVPPTVNVGDIVPFKFPDLESGDFCNNFFDITTVVKAKSDSSIWLEDINNPANGFSDAEYVSLSLQLDTLIYAEDVRYLGQPTDLDANDRVVIVVSERVNRRGGVLGFVVSTDLVPSGSGALECPSSNFGEVYYAKAPDSLGTVDDVYLGSDAINDAPFLIAHEFAHVIQFSRRLWLVPGAMEFPDRWEGEGQATFAEEVVGFAYENKSSHQDYGLDVVFNDDDNSDVDWFGQPWFDLSNYFGWLGGSNRTSLGPHECSWLGNSSVTTPCTRGRQHYGTPYNLLRWLSDHLGSTFPGGEPGVQRALVNGTVAGFANFEAELGVDMDTVLAKWAATLYVDNLIIPADPALDLPSWNMRDIYYGTSVSGRMWPESRLTPAASTFGDFTRTVNVRDASNYYLLVSGASRPTVAIKARTTAGTALPGHMQYWIVRTQ
jgi:hypothetical protein